MPTGAIGSNLRACSLCAEYFAPDAASTRFIMSAGATSDCGNTEINDVRLFRRGTNLVASTDHNMRTAEELRNSAGVSVE